LEVLKVNVGIGVAGWPLALRAENVSGVTCPATSEIVEDDGVDAGPSVTWTTALFTVLPDEDPPPQPVSQIVIARMIAACNARMPPPTWVFASGLLGSVRKKAQKFSVVSEPDLFKAPNSNTVAFLSLPPGLRERSEVDKRSHAYLGYPIATKICGAKRKGLVFSSKHKVPESDRPLALVSIIISAAAETAVLVIDAAPAVVPVVKLGPYQPAVFGLAQSAQRIAADIDTRAAFGIVADGH
jgi:hypothetical protein